MTTTTFRAAYLPADNGRPTRTDLRDYAREGESTRAALARAAAEGLTLCSYSDPTAEGREGLTEEEAAEIAAQDASLIYVVRSCVVRAAAAVSAGEVRQ